MKKRTVLIFIVVALIVGLLATPASAAGGKLTLLSAKVKKGQSVFAFRVHGSFGSFSGTAYHGGTAYPLVCKVRPEDPDILLCRGNKVLGDKYVQVVVNGRSWTTLVVATPAYCNPVYDVPYLPDTVWWYYGDYCTDTEPEINDSATLSEFYPVGTWTYLFKDNGLCPGVNDFGTGWYWLEYNCVMP